MDELDLDIEQLEEELRRLKYTPEWWKMNIIEGCGLALFFLGLPLMFLGAFNVWHFSSALLYLSFCSVLVLVGISLAFQAQRYGWKHFEDYMMATDTLRILRAERKERE